MARDVHPDVVTELGGQSLRPVHLVELVLQQLTVRLNDSPREITYAARTYFPAGYLLGVNPGAERLDIAIEQATVALSGVDQFLISALLQYDYRNRSLKIWRGYLAADCATLAGDPVLIWEGLTSHVAIGESPPDAAAGEAPRPGSCTISVSATSIWWDHQRAPGRIFSDACQRIYFPDDRGLEFSDRPFADLPWGKP
jgi:hypothetical protein